ncbi:hypothetical protein Ntsu_18170 [Nocardia sp. IFM 10818]
MCELVELLATNPMRAAVTLVDTLDTTDPDWWDSPESIVIEALRRDGLIYFDWRNDASEIRRDLERLPAFPKGLSWDWYDWRKVDNWDPDYRRAFLQQLADRLLEIDVALIGIYVDGDGLTLGLLPADQLDRFAELASAAEVRTFVYRSGAPTA